MRKKYTLEMIAEYMGHHIELFSQETNEGYHYSYTINNGDQVFCSNAYRDDAMKKAYNQIQATNAV